MCLWNFIFLWINLANTTSKFQSSLLASDGIIIGINIKLDTSIDNKWRKVLSLVSRARPVSVYLCFSKLHPLSLGDGIYLLPHNVYIKSILANMNHFCGLETAESHHRGMDYLFLNLSYPTIDFSSIIPLAASKTMFLEFSRIDAAVDCIGLDLAVSTIQCVGALAAQPTPFAIAKQASSLLIEPIEEPIQLPSIMPQPEICQLWWPINGSELFIHSPVPAHLSPLRIKQRIIISCPWPTHSRVTIYDHVRIEDGDDVKIVTTSATLIDDTGEERRKRRPQVIDISILLTHSTYPSLHSYDGQKSLVIEVHTFHSLLATFHVDMNIVYGNNLPNPPKLFSRSNIVPLLASQLETRDDLGFALSTLLPYATSFLEVGVHSGKFAELILQTAGNINSYIGIDSWRIWPESEYIDLANDVQAVHDQNYQDAVDRLSSIFEGLDKSISLLNMTSLEAARIIANESIDIVYIDAMHHYHAVQADINAWWPKVKPCGLLAGHDYLLDVISDTVFTVKPAVQEFARREGLLLLQTYDEEKVAFPTWMLYKPCL